MKTNNSDTRITCISMIHSISTYSHLHIWPLWIILIQSKPLWWITLVYSERLLELPAIDYALLRSIWLLQQRLYAITTRNDSTKDVNATRYLQGNWYAQGFGKERGRFASALNNLPWMILTQLLAHLVARKRGRYHLQHSSQSMSGNAVVMYTPLQTASGRSLVLCAKPYRAAIVRAKRHVMSKE